MENIRVIHADDHKIVRNAIKSMAEKSAPHIQIVGEAASYQELFKVLETTKADLLLLDGVIIGGDITEYLPIIKDKYPDLKILLFWMHVGRVDFTKWDHLLDGQLSLSVNFIELVTAIEIIMKGEKYYNAGS